MGSCAGYSQVTTGSSKMPTFNLMPKEGLSLPRLSISVSMIIRLVLVCVDCVVIGIIGYYFAYYRGSYRQNLFHEELMVLVCATSAFINAAIFIMAAAVSSSSYQASAEVISNFVTAFLLIISAMVLLIQMSINGKYFVNHYEAKVFCGVLSIINGTLYILFGMFSFRRTQVNM